MTQRKRSELLPALSALALLDLTMLLLARVAGPGLALPLGFAIILGYVTYFALATRDIVTNVHRLDPLDRSLCRWSGPLALLIAVTLLLVAIIAAQKGAAEVWFRSRSGLLPIKYAVEVGLILSVACRLASDELGHVPPRTFWRTVSTPLLVVFGVYVILIPVGEFVAGRRPEAIGRQAVASRHLDHTTHEIMVTIDKSNHQNSVTTQTACRLSTKNP